VEINSCLSLINSTINAQAFIESRFDDFQNFGKNPNASIPFTDKITLRALHEIIYSKIFDNFLLYLKIILLAIEANGDCFSLNKTKAINQYTFDRIRNELDKFKIINKENLEWNKIINIKKTRDTFVHQSELKNVLDAFLHQRTDLIKQRKLITAEDIFVASESLISFAKLLDKKLIANYDVFSALFKRIHMPPA
jgi:hypothetical protein